METRAKRGCDCRGVRACQLCWFGASGRPGIPRRVYERMHSGSPSARSDRTGASRTSSPATATHSPNSLRTVRELMRDQQPSSPAAALRKEEHGQQQSAMANVEAAVRALHSFIVEVEQGANATPRGSHEAIHLEQMPSSFRSLKRLGQRLDESFALLNQVRLGRSVLPPNSDSGLRSS